MLDPAAIPDIAAAFAVICVLTMVGAIVFVGARRALRKPNTPPQARIVPDSPATAPVPGVVAPTPPDPPPALALEDGLECALLIKHIFPPQPPLTRLSFFGGAPLAPVSFDWPIAAGDDGVRRPLDFMGQIDCRAIPSGPLRAHLPADGILYFFAPLDDAVSRADSAVCVRWARGETREYVFLEQPPKPQDALRQWRYDWVASSARRRSFIRDRAPRIEIECGWAPSFRPVEVERELQPIEASFSDWQARRHAALVAFHGEPAPIDDFLAPHALRGERSFEPFEGFPPNWMAIEIVAAHFIRQFESAPCDDLSALEEGRRLLEAARAEAPISEPSHEQKRAFLDWLRRIAMSPLLNLRADRPGAAALAREIPSWVSEAAILSCEAALTDGAAAARTPPRVVSALKRRHSALRHPDFDHGAARQHQMLGHARLTFGQSEELSNTHHLLMQFDADEALGWDFGDGAYQYWITPADLAAQRFSAVVLSFEGS